jgi:hypothetical protein
MPANLSTASVVGATSCGGTSPRASIAVTNDGKVRGKSCTAYVWVASFLLRAASSIVHVRGNDQCCDMSGNNDNYEKIAAFNCRCMSGARTVCLHNSSSHLPNFRARCGPVILFSRGFADSRENWGFGLGLERILAWWQAAAVSGVHGVHRRRPCCPS